MSSPSDTNHPVLTEATLIDWRLNNSDKPFDDEEFLKGLDEHAQKSNELFDRVFVPETKT